MHCYYVPGTVSRLLNTTFYADRGRLEGSRDRCVCAPAGDADAEAHVQKLTQLLRRPCEAVHYPRRVQLMPPAHAVPTAVSLKHVRGGRNWTGLGAGALGGWVRGHRWMAGTLTGMGRAHEITCQTSLQCEC